MLPARARCAATAAFNSRWARYWILASIESASVLPVLRRAYALHVLDDVPEPVLDHPTAPSPARELLLKGELERLPPASVHVSNADEVRRHLARRVIPAILALQEHPGNAQGDHARGVIRRQLPLEIDELAPGVGELFPQLGRVHPEQPGEALLQLGRDLDVRRARRHRLHGGGDREWLVVAVHDPAARGGKLDHARVARLPLLLQEVVVQSLQVESAQGERRKPREQSQQ